MIRPRRSFLGLDTLDLDHEEIQCLQLLIELGQVPPPYKEAKERLDRFRQRHTLHLINASKSQAETVEMRAAPGWFLPGRVRHVVEREPPTKQRLSAGAIRRVAALRSLEDLTLPDLDPEVVPALGDLTSLKSLSFAVNRPCDLQWLSHLTRLEKIDLEGDGIRDLRVLAQCPALLAIHLLHCSTESLEEIPLGPQLRSLELGYLPLDSLAGIERASGLEHLQLSGLAAGLPERLPQLQRLHSLKIDYPKCTMLVPYAQLSLEELWLQGTDSTALSGLEGAAS